MAVLTTQRLHVPGISRVNLGTWRRRGKAAFAPKLTMSSASELGDLKDALMSSEMKNTELKQENKRLRSEREKLQKESRRLRQERDAMRSLLKANTHYGLTKDDSSKKHQATFSP